MAEYERALGELEHDQPSATLSVMMTGFGLRLDPHLCWENLRRLSKDAADRAIGLTVNTVTPGYTMTEMVAAVPEKVLIKIRGQIPLRRLGRPHEVARVVAFLADDASSYITGQVWGVNGGLDM